MPHAVAVDDCSACPFGNADHQTVDMVRTPATCFSEAGRGALRPGLAHHVMIAANAAGRDDDTFAAETETAGDNSVTIAGRARHSLLKHVTGHAGNNTAGPFDWVTRWRKRHWMRPDASCARRRRMNGASTPGPVPQVRWKRGTELPWPSAWLPPRSAQPTTGNQRMPMPCSHERIGPAAKSR